MCLGYLVGTRWVTSSLTLSTAAAKSSRSPDTGSQSPVPQCCLKLPLSVPSPLVSVSLCFPPLCPCPGPSWRAGVSAVTPSFLLTHWDLGIHTKHAGLSFLACLRNPSWSGEMLPPRSPSQAQAGLDAGGPAPSPCGNLLCIRFAHPVGEEPLVLQRIWSLTLNPSLLSYHASCVILTTRGCRLLACGHLALS